MAKTFKASLRVRFSELDLYGHVHHAEYLRYLEWARMEYLKQAGVSFVELMEKGIFVVVVNADLNFNSPARYDEELIISGVIKEIGTTSLTMMQRIEERRTKRNILEAQFTFVFLGKDRRKIPVPEDLLRFSL
jgi:YbgC/YbaW family acyl-CoA thioester hydrolase